MLGVLMLAGCLAAVVRVGAAAAVRARADAVADLSALASVTGGPHEGQHVARANGAEVMSNTTDGTTAVIRIKVDGITARAAARPAR